MSKNNVPQNTLFDSELFETEPQENPKKPKTPRTYLNCDIHAMNKRDFIAFCRKEYDRIHNREEPTRLPKEIKQLEHQFSDEAFKILKNKKKKSEYRHIQNLSYHQETQRMTRRIQSLACSYYGKPFQDMTNKDKDRLIPYMKTIYAITQNYLIGQDEQNTSWHTDKENFDETTATNVKSLKSFLRNYIKSKNQTEPDEAFLKTLVNWYKKILPEKRVECKKNKVHKYKEFYSSNMITTLYDQLENTFQKKEAKA